MYAPRDAPASQRHSRAIYPFVSAWVWVTWAAANAVGGLLVGSPDTGTRLFSFSRTHGPSALDALGSVVLLAGWIVLDAVIGRRDALRSLGRRWLIGAAILLAVGIAVLVPTIAFDLGAWWILGVAILAGIQLAIAVAVSRRSSAFRQDPPTTS